MDIALRTLIEVIQNGGPVGFALLLAYFWYVEKKENQAKDKAIAALTEKLLALASAQIESNITNHTAIMSLKETIKDWRSYTVHRGEG